ncbi:MAG: V-type ATP synthase subunit F [Clostridiales bacterium]|nr:V-type ATP synthase subunit F [Clostridiales bacterium]
MADIAMIGDKDSVLLGRAAGIDVYFETEGQAAGKLIDRLARENTKIIFVTEKVFEAASETVNKYKSRAFPAIIPVPDSTGANGAAMANVKANVEKAIGADILF